MSSILFVNQSTKIIRACTSYRKDSPTMYLYAPTLTEVYTRTRYLKIMENFYRSHYLWPRYLRNKMYSTEAKFIQFSLLPPGEILHFFSVYTSLVRPYILSLLTMFIFFDFIKIRATITVSNFIFPTEFSRRSMAICMILYNFATLWYPKFDTVNS